MSEKLTFKSKVETGISQKNIIMPVSHDAGLRAEICPGSLAGCKVGKWCHCGLRCVVASYNLELTPYIPFKIWGEGRRKYFFVIYRQFDVKKNLRDKMFREYFVLIYEIVKILWPFQEKAIN